MSKGREPKDLTREQIAKAIQYSQSNRGAAIYLGVSYPTYRKYASLYKDELTGKSLWELHRNRGGAGMHKYALTPASRKGRKPIILDILSGRVPATHFNAQRLKKQLIELHFLKPVCGNCGFKEKRLIDGKTPLILHHKDGNKKNWKIENLEFLCYNCSFLLGLDDCPISEDFVEKTENFGDDVTTKKENKEIFELDSYQKEYLKTLGLPVKNSKKGYEKYVAKL
jgi:hypothetical protein